MNKYSINPTELTKELSRQTGITQKEIRLVLHAMEDFTKQQLTRSDSSQKVEIKFFPGLTLVSEYICSYEAKNPPHRPPDPTPPPEENPRENQQESEGVCKYGGVKIAKFSPFPRQWKVVRQKKLHVSHAVFLFRFFHLIGEDQTRRPPAWLHILLPFLPAIHYQLTQDRRWFVIANSSFILLLKEKVKSEIVSDPLIVKTIGSPNYTKDDPVLSGEDVKENYIFTWNQNPNLTDGQITYITLQAHIKVPVIYGLPLLLKFGSIVTLII